jgi:hypothetical protein
VEFLVLGGEGRVDPVADRAGPHEANHIGVEVWPPVLEEDEVLSAADAEVARGGVDALQDVRTVIRWRNLARGTVSHAAEEGVISIPIVPRSALCSASVGARGARCVLLVLEIVESVCVRPDVVFQEVIIRDRWKGQGSGGARLIAQGVGGLAELMCGGEWGHPAVRSQ